MTNFFELNEYQEQINRLMIATRPSEVMMLLYMTVAMAEQLVDMANALKAFETEQSQNLPEKTRFEIAENLEFCLITIATMADGIGIKVSYIAGQSVEKLKLLNSEHER